MVEIQSISRKKKRMFVFRCSCGDKILVIPDVKEMTKAIKNHLIEHRKLTGERVTEEILTQEILKALGEYYS